MEFKLAQYGYAEEYFVSFILLKGQSLPLIFTEKNPELPNSEINIRHYLPKVKRRLSYSKLSRPPSLFSAQFDFISFQSLVRVVSRAGGKIIGPLEYLHIPT